MIESGLHTPLADQEYVIRNGASNFIVTGIALSLLLSYALLWIEYFPQHLAVLGVQLP